MNIPQLHDMDLGEKLTEAEITGILAAAADSEELRAFLQLLRNEHATYGEESHALMEQDRERAATLKIGAAQGLRWIAERLWLDAHSEPEAENDSGN